jgi:hypothetical protein
VLYQTGPHFFSYTVFNPDGDLVARQTYEYVNTRPRLHANREGEIKVEGGTRHTAPNDVPPAAPASAPDEAAKNPPARAEESPKTKP